MTKFRTERDTMGEMQVPADALYGASTARAVDNFPIAHEPVPASVIHAFGHLKAACAIANQELGKLDAKRTEAIVAASRDVAAGKYDEHFPVDIYQTGSGTSTNMNANEVIANLANQRLGLGLGAKGAEGAVHPNDHVNMGQSSNDVIPTAMHLAALEAVERDLLVALQHLHGVLEAKAYEFDKIIKIGRTHLQDATPIRLGQEFSGYASQIAHGMSRLEKLRDHLGELAIGGTAVGTGLNAPPDFGAEVVRRLAKRTGLPLTEATDHIAAQASRDGLVEASGQLRTTAVALTKVANDLRWMASGPRTGLAEIRLPDLQPGSSIMPGKVNPVLCEAVTQVAAQVMGNDAAVAFSGSQGNFELNVYLPVMARNVLESIDLLANVSRVFADRCVAGIEADVERCRTNAESSPAIATSLNPYLGYERTAQLIKESQRTGTSIRELVAATGELSEEELDRALDALALTRGGVAGS
ncbi:MAG: class II fumarate hydratase [Planctomycetales bacterium]|nr:class II fumarate hydratase [Planctomycetales bacterium]